MYGERGIVSFRAMWLLFHRNAKTRAVPDGKSFVDTCPECDRRATFSEVEITENIGLFFIDILGDKERAYRCGACGGVFDLKDQAPAVAAPAKPQRSAADLERDRVAQQEQLRAAAQAKAIQIDDELAELKKRMGR